MLPAVEARSLNHWTTREVPTDVSNTVVLLGWCSNPMWHQFKNIYTTFQQIMMMSNITRSLMGPTLLFLSAIPSHSQIMGRWGWRADLGTNLSGPQQVCPDGLLSPRDAGNFSRQDMVAQRENFNTISTIIQFTLISYILQTPSIQIKRKGV